MRHGSTPQREYYRRDTFRLYGTQRWRRLAQHQLSLEPLCRLCEAEGRLTPASVADHVSPHKGDEAAFWGGELQSLCKSCHDSAKARQERSGVLPGCSADGVPLDAAHHWNQK